jgi:predicted DsbA family dithiol-disulfide isomerase
MDDERSSGDASAAGIGTVGGGASGLPRCDTPACVGALRTPGRRRRSYENIPVGVGLVAPVDEQRDHIQGSADAPVTLVRYGDYECPYCGQAYPIIKQIAGRMGDRLRFVFRNFPIPTSHPHAQQAAEAAEGAGGQSKFWKMHDLLYERQRHLTDADMHAYAAELGIGVGRFDREMADHLYADRVEEDLMSGVRSGVSGTPTFYINVSGTTTLTSSTCSRRRGARRRGPMRFRRG